MQSRVTWWIHEVKVHQVVDTQLLELQHHSAQVGTQDLRVGVLLHLIRVGLLWRGRGRRRGRRRGRGGEGRGERGGEGRGGEGKGREGKGREGKGREGKGREGKGREGKGREGKGREGKGREGKGREGKGREGKGREGKGREGKGRGVCILGPKNVRIPKPHVLQIFSYPCRAGSTCRGGSSQPGRPAAGRWP